MDNTIPYYSVIFSSTRTVVGESDYQQTAQAMLELAKQQPGYLGVDSVHESTKGITVSYWRDLDSIKAWKNEYQHRHAQQLGREQWYSAFEVRIAKVESYYSLD